MRNDTTSALATGEISDSELDNISGGMAGGPALNPAGLQIDASVDAHLSLAPGQAHLSAFVSVHANV